MGALTGSTPNKDNSPMLTAKNPSEGQSALSALAQQQNDPSPINGQPQRPVTSNTSMLDEYLKSVLAQS